MAAAGGALRFDEFMRVALYGDSGFYSSGGAGRRRDFLTSPEVGPLFGTVLARWIEGEWRRLGEPEDFTVVECGAGPGTLARAVLAAAPRWRDRYLAVELSAVQRAQHPDGVVSTDVLPGGLGNGVVLANELLDNLPFRLAVFDGGWREVAVARHGSRFVEVTLPRDPAWTWLPEPAAHGSRLPIQDAAAAWVHAARRTISQGSVMAIDYCTSRTDQLLRMSWRDWLRTYRSHERGTHYLDAPGTQDITCQVCVDQLPAPDEVRDQAAFLAAWGIDELAEEGRRAWSEHAARPTLADVAMRSRVVEAEALCDPRGLGGFSVLRWTAAEMPHRAR
jgi:SAM-dependent MidA family methyltransferase